MTTKAKKILSIILIISVLGSAAPCALAVDAPVLSSAKNVIVGDADTGRVFFALDADKSVPPASTTKMMLLLLCAEAIERGEITLTDPVTCSADAWDGLSDDCGNAAIFEGETMPLGDLLYCIALISACEACNIVAEYISGSVDGFVKLMNERAKELGCTGTHFVNTHGLPAEGHLSTARDLFIIACEGMRHELFRTLVGTAEYVVPPTNDHADRTLWNSNALISSKAVYGDDYLYEGACGIKTGRTSEAGFCLASAAERDGVSLIAIVLGADREDERIDSFVDSISLLDWGFENCERKTLVAAGEKLGTQRIKGEVTDGTMTLNAAEEMSAVILKGTLISTELRLDDGIDAAAPGDRVGECVIYDENGAELGTAALVSGGTEYDPVPTPGPEPAPEVSAGMRSASLILGILFAAAAAVVIVVLIIKNRKGER